MVNPKSLLTRLNRIGEALSHTSQCHALLGLGSVGKETDRLDAYSDIDFFVIAKMGFKQRFIENLDWLSKIGNLGYVFRNTADGYKVLFEEGIFCEFAVFEPQELAEISFSAGRIVWQEEGFDSSTCQPCQKRSEAPAPNPNVEWQIGEALTNLYVGMGRERRGEKLTAMRFIQSYALDRLIDLVRMQDEATSVSADPFMPDRRIETRFPSFASHLKDFAQGYKCNAASALAQLDFLERHFEVNKPMAKAIKQLCVYEG
ncbi:hypothetical protein ACPV5L_15690 [Vibrio astriarenae]